MNWMQDVSKLLEQYNSAQPEQAPDNVDGDFDQVAQTAPQPAIADGLAAAFRSEKTPEFGQMASNLFTNSDSTQQAGLLNTILKYAGPAILGALTSRAAGGNATGGGGGGLSDLIEIIKGGQKEVTPEQAEQISPDVVKEVAEQAEKQDPSIIDRISDFYAEHPMLVKTLGTAALTIALSKIANRQTNR